MGWRIGKRFCSEVLNSEQADYVEEILPTVSAELVPRYERYIDARSLWCMM